MADASIPTIIVTGAVTAALGPLLGPLSLIIFAAVAGSALAMRRVKMENLSRLPWAFGWCSSWPLPWCRLQPPGIGGAAFLWTL